MSKKYEDDEEILEKLKHRNRTTEKVIFQRYREYFKSYLIKRFGCSLEESLSIYPECFTIFCFNIREGKLEAPLKAALKTYLCSIGWRILLKRFPKFRAAKNRPSPGPQVVSLEAEEWEKIGGAMEIYDRIDWEAKALFLKKLLAEIDKKCQDVIRLRFWENASHEEVMERMAFSSVGAARKRSFDCLKKLRKLLLESDDIEEYL